MGMNGPKGTQLDLYFWGVYESLNGLFNFNFNFFLIVSLDSKMELWHFFYLVLFLFKVFFLKVFLEESYVKYFSRKCYKQFFNTANHFSKF